MVPAMARVSKLHPNWTVVELGCIGPVAGQRKTKSLISYYWISYTLV